MFKLVLAIIFAVIAALMVFVVGLFSDARLITSFLRGMVAFFVAGIASYIVLFLFEVTRTVFFDKMPSEVMINADVGESQDSTSLAEEDIDENELAISTDDTVTGSVYEGEDLEEGVSEEFQPLASEDFIRLTTPTA